MKNSENREEKQLIPGIWTSFDNESLDLSETFVMVNARGLASYCAGGDSITALNYFRDFQETVELGRNYPYSMLEEGRALFSAKKPLFPALSAADRLIPARSIRLGSVHSNYFAFPAEDESSGLVINL